MPSVVGNRSEHREALADCEEPQPLPRCHCKEPVTAKPAIWSAGPPGRGISSPAEKSSSGWKPSLPLA